VALRPRGEGARRAGVPPRDGARGELVRRPLERRPFADMPLNRGHGRRPLPRLQGGVEVAGRGPCLVGGVGEKADSRRFVPTELLRDVYAAINLTIPPSEIATCMGAFYVAVHAERHLGGAVPFFYDNRAPHLEEELEGWFEGGLDDMALKTAWKWRYFFDSLSQTSKMNNSAQAPFASAPSRDEMPLARPRFVADVRQVDGGHEISVSAHLWKQIGWKGSGEFARETVKALASMASEDAGISRVPLSKAKVESMLSCEDIGGGIGTAMASGDIDGDGFDDVIVGAGCEGRGDNSMNGVVRVGFSTLNGSSRVWKILEGVDSAARFGSSVASGDFDGDGFADLAIGAPLFGKGGVTEFEDFYPKTAIGKVFVYFGPSLERFITISADIGDEYSNFGAFLGSSDCDGDGMADLLVGSRLGSASADQQGIAVVVSGKDSFSKSSNVSVVAKFIGIGTRPYSWFGAAMACGDGKLFVGAPNDRPGSSEIQASGSVFVYDMTFDGHRIDPAPIASLHCNQSSARFGASIKFQGKTGLKRQINSLENLLFVGSPDFTPRSVVQAGSVFVLDNSKLSEGSEIWIESELHYPVALRGNIIGQEVYARLGWDFVVHDGSSMQSLSFLIQQPLS
jgi:hypothetical protein